MLLPLFVLRGELSCPNHITVPAESKGFRLRVGEVSLARPCKKNVYEFLTNLDMSIRRSPGREKHLRSVKDAYPGLE